MLKKISIIFLALLILAGGCAFAIDWSSDFKVGLGYTYAPNNMMLKDLSNLADKESYDIFATSSWDFKYLGFDLRVTPDYIKKDYYHISFDLGADVHYRYKNFTVKAGALLPFTLDDGRFGIGDVQMKNVRTLLKQGQKAEVFCETEIFIATEYQFANRICVGSALNFPAVRATQESMLLGEIIKETLNMSTLNFFVTYRVH